MKNAIRFVLVLGCLFSLPTPLLYGQSTDACVDKAVQFLREKAPADNKIGHMAMAIMALVKSGARPEDPVVQGLTLKVKAAIAGGKLKEYTFKDGNTHHGHDNYQVAVVLMALSTLGAEQNLKDIQDLAAYLMNKQSPDGAWDYDGKTSGDTSMSQYAILALWDAANAGVEIPLTVWDKALDWHIRTQDPGGGFGYHPAMGGNGQKMKQKVTPTMSFNGTTSMFICRSQLPYPERKKKEYTERELLIPAGLEDEEKEIKLINTKEVVDAAIDAGERWISNNFQIAGIRGVGDDLQAAGAIQYYLYGVERYASFLEAKKIGTTDWYAAGARQMATTQRPDGSWDGVLEPVCEASFAVLFLRRSTEKTIQKAKISRLGRGTMVGGRGIPTEDGPLTGLAARQKARYRNALRVPATGLLAALEDPESVQLDSVTAAIETVDPQELLKAVEGKTKRLRALTKHELADVRKGALWALAKTRDLRTVPVLINALKDENVDVSKAAEECLRYISRRYDGLQLADDATKEQVAAAMKGWTDWYNNLRVVLEPEQEYDE